MTATNPPREATRRVSDQEHAADLAKYDGVERGGAHLPVAYIFDLRDSRALVADLTRRLAEAERREREAWCAGRDAALVCFDQPVKVWPTGWRETYPALAAPNAEQVKRRILDLNPPKPEGDRG